MNEEHIFVFDVMLLQKSTHAVKCFSHISGIQGDPFPFHNTVYQGKYFPAVVSISVKPVLIRKQKGILPVQLCKTLSQIFPDAVLYYRAASTLFPGNADANNLSVSVPVKKLSAYKSCLGSAGSGCVENIVKIDSVFLLIGTDFPVSLHIALRNGSAMSSAYNKIGMLSFPSVGCFPVFYGLCYFCYRAGLDHCPKLLHKSSVIQSLPVFLRRDHMAGKSHRGCHIRYDPAVIGAVTAIGHHYIRITVFDFPVKFRRFPYLVSSKAEGQHIIPFYIKMVITIVT